jgi:hypothetical protein
MRFSRKRKLTGPMKPVNVMVTKTAREKLDKIAGPASLAETVEKLVEREYARRERKLTLQVQDSSCL